MSGGAAGEGVPPRSRALLERARRGDDEAYREIFQLYAPRLTARLESCVQGTGLARRVGTEDLLQEVFTQFTRTADRIEYRGTGSLYRWLCRVADNAVRMAARAHLGSDRRALSRERSYDAEPDSGSAGARLPAAVDPSPSTIASTGERLKALSRLLERLSDDHRAVIELVYVERISIADAAERLGRTRNAVKKLLGRAMERCAQLAATESFAAYRSEIRPG